MLKWVSVAPFGEPVVPLVNWILIASSGSSAAESPSSRPRWPGPANDSNCENRLMPRGCGPSSSTTIWRQRRRLHRQRRHHQEIVAPERFVVRFAEQPAEILRLGVEVAAVMLDEILAGQ